MLERGLRSTRLARFLVGAAVLLWVLLAIAPTARAEVNNPAQGPGGPILIVTSDAPATFGTYYAEILRTEGFNSFAVATISNVSEAMLAAYDVVLLAKMPPLATDKVAALTTWVNAGGNLIAMAPDPQLAGLLGITQVGSALSNGYLLVDTSAAPGNGIVGQTIQFHGAAELYNLNGAASVATLYSTANTATSNPAVTLRAVGSGKAAAFTYDLAESIVYTRQGNPAWAAQERDGIAPIRSDDKFYGNKAGDVQPDWVDLDKVAIPQADEQQRLLANLILHMNASKKPLPRFWYFPNGKKAVVIMTGDDHGNNGTFGRFEQFKSLSPAGCSVANWECVRGTSYVFPNTPITDAQVAGFVADGFEVGVHINTGCGDFNRDSLQDIYDAQVPEFQAAFPSAGPLRTQRHHCIAWSDWSSGAEVQLSKGMRLDTSYYYWPPSWVNGVPGMFTGSAMPMRFTKLNGEFIDVYMAATQMTDESGQAYPYTVDTLLDRALGAEGYYGAYTVNAHTDVPTIVESDTVVVSALARGVPIVSAQQMLTWLDARNASSFGAMNFVAGTLTFTVTKDPAANGLQAMLPARHGSKVLSAVSLGNSPVGFSVSAIKGVEYAFFNALGGIYTATYADDTTSPQVVSTSPAAGATGISATARPSATFGEAMDASTINPNTFELRNAAGSIVSAAVVYDGATRTATLVPASPLAASETFTATLRGGASAPQIKDLAGNALTSSLSWSFTTASGPVCPCGGWDPAATPANPSEADPNPVELGVKFTSDVSGFITGVRFYKGSGNTGTHIGNLWSNSGALLATATFTAETGSGWQEVSFANAVPITANTVYVASYFAPNGNYAGDSQFFANASVYKAPIRLLQDGASGGNGVYAYGAASSFPASTYQATNYWVDVVFSSVGPVDNTPPTVTAFAPSNGATGVAVTASISATFSEAVDAAAVTSGTFQLRTSANALVPATVSYNAATRTATLTPTSPLSASASYTATVVGGDTDPRIKDVAGNTLASSLVWTFTTGAASACPCGGWVPSSTPTNPSVADPDSVELGVKFTSDVNGFVTGIRFYKGAGNTGTHIGNLWTSAGVQLATATFTGETASGWQEVTFANPVAITANTVYVASYFAPNGRYAGDYQFFAATSVYNPPIRLLQNGVSGGNGVYTYGATSSFPSSTYQSTNYWVDVVFNTVGPADSTPPTVTSTLPANGATGVAIGSTVNVTFSEAVDPATVSSSTVSLVGPGASAVAGTVSYNAATRTATFTPNGPLAASTSYTATIRGGSSGPVIKDVAGNALAANVTLSFTTGGVGGSCGAPANAIVAENCLAGNPVSEWDVAGIGDPSIQGFATDISVNRGGTVSFKVDTTAANYRFDIYRMGYYAGLGARKIATVFPATPQSQPSCLNDAATGLIDCGNWSVSGSWNVPATAVSGIYFAKVVRADNGGASHIFFVVRDDAGTSDLLFQTSDTTWQAYNDYGGNSLYKGSPAGRAYKVSYNRPFYTRAVDGGQDWVFNAEYPMVRWLEANGYDISYFSGVDTDRFGNLITRHKTFLSVGHDEYWSGNQRANVEAARNAGVNLAFFSGNEVFWKTRWENSMAPSGAAYRTLVSYKETHANAKIDPTATWTGTWRDPRFSPPADGGRPENALTGTIFMANDTGVPYSILVPESDGKMRFWRNTNIAMLGSGQSATLPLGTLGYEWDSDLDNGFRPAGLIRLSTTTLTFGGALLDHGSNYGTGTQTHALTLYKHSSGARVFGAGTIQWSWGLDANHDRSGMSVDPRMQQATVNLFADMGVQPATLQPGLLPATASTDAVAPSSAITSPAQSANVTPGSAITITGTASDAGGGVVGGVEVSIDGGATWRRANGRSNWSFSWTPSAAGTVTIKSRAADDSGNLETPGAGVSMNVAAQTCPCTIWPAAATPAVVSDNDPAAVTVGAKFRSDQNGYITAIRFYKGPNNTGTHVGGLWTAAGQQLATVTFSSETASGWQQANLSTPVAITANSVYVVGYHAPDGQYSGDDDYFQLTGVDNPPLHALRDGESGANGVYLYGSALAFPTQTYRSENYWVDVVFTTMPSTDSTPPTVTTVTPASGASNVAINSVVTATFSETMNASTISGSSFILRDASGTQVPATVGYNASTFVATLTPVTALTGATTYTATVTGGSSGVKDPAGNALAADRVWSFATVAVDITPPSVTTTSPTSGATGVSRTASVTVAFNEAMNSATVNAGTFVLRDAAGSSIVASVSYNAATFVATLTPAAALAGSATYTATVLSGASGVKDVAGNALATDRVWSFTTVAADTTAPTVTAITPASGASGVSGTANVTATFSEAMDAATVSTTTVELRNAAGNLVAAAVSYNTSTRVVTLNPTPTLTPSATYTATIRGGASDPRVKDLAGNALAVSQVWTFTVAGEITPPTVSANSPASGATGVSTVILVTATFSEALDPSTIGSSTFELRIGSGAPLAAAVTYNATTRVATLTPAVALDPSTTYTAIVRGGATEPRVKDLAGNALAVNRTWSFTTVAAPTVTSTSPAAGAAGISPTANVTATFSRAMNSLTINSSTVELRDPTNAVVPSVLTYNSSTRVATLNPTPNLIGGAIYTAFVRGGATGVKDSTGNALVADRVWTFTIETTPPTVTTNSPANGATRVSRTANITATFSEAMDTNTISTGTVELRDSANNLIAGVVTYNTSTRVVTLNPTPTLAAQSNYTVTIKGGTTDPRVKDLAGNALAINRVWTFRTGS